MPHTKPQLLFMGSPDFAAVSLKALIEAKYPIVGVVTQPDKPKGRGKTLAITAVKELAQQYQLPILQPASCKDPSFAAEVQKLHPDLLVVIAFGQILPQAILDIPPYGAINVHGSLLPALRGSAPIQWAIINGDSITGVTTMQMDQGVDTGDILLSTETDITPSDTAASLHDRLAHLGADLLLQTLHQVKEKSLMPLPQDNRKATYARMLTKKDGLIPWQKSAKEIDCLIRGVTPWPRAFTPVQGKRLLVHRATPVETQITQLPGTVVEVSPTHLLIATGKGLLSLEEVQPESGKRLTIQEYLCGNATHVGDCWGEAS